jgi:hypothetical protein
MAFKEGQGDERKLIIHDDNAHPQTTHPSVQFLKQNQMKTAPHPPYSAYSPHPTSWTFTCLVISKDALQVSQLRTQMNFFRQFSKSSLTVKSDIAGNVF